MGVNRQLFLLVPSAFNFDKECATNHYFASLYYHLPQNSAGHVLALRVIANFHYAPILSDLANDLAELVFKLCALKLE